MALAAVVAVLHDGHEHAGAALFARALTTQTVDLAVLVNLEITRILELIICFFGQKKYSAIENVTVMYLFHHGFRESRQKFERKTDFYRAQRPN